MTNRVTNRWMAVPGKRVRLADIDPGSTPGAPGDKEETQAELPELGEKLAALQDRMWAERSRSLLVVAQGMDGSGKDGTIRHVFGPLAPQATRVVAFKAPTEAELAHDFLWRVHNVTPGHGEIVIFNRSHYEDVVAVRVRGLAPESVWRPRYELINGFEKTLVHGGATVVKLFLYISKKEQRERFEARLERPDKQWKFRHGDLVDRKLWDEYQTAYEDAINATSTPHAPWHIIPSNSKWYRNWAVSRILLATLEGMDPQYPEPEDLSDVAIP